MMKTKDNPLKRLLIVGDGSAAVATLVALSRRISVVGLPANLAVDIVDGTEREGTGVAFEPGSPKVHLLNRQSSRMGIVSGCPGDFERWLATLGDDSRALLRDNFVPRSYFGAYLQHRRKEAIEELRRWGVVVNRHHGVVVSLLQTGADSVWGRCWVAKLQGGRAIEADTVLLALGLGASKALPGVGGLKNYIAEPYPADRMKRIPSGADVVIAGSRLTAIDAAFFLLDSGHTGNISLWSRSGLLPVVRGPEYQRELVFLSDSFLASQVRHLGRSLSIDELANLFKREVELWEGKTFDLGKFCNPIGINPIRWFENELSEVGSGPRPWQSLLALLTTQSHMLLRYFSSEVREKICQLSLRHIFDHYHTPIPPESANRLLTALRSGRLEFITGDYQIKALDAVGTYSDKFILFHGVNKNIVRQCDFIVDGRGRSIYRSREPLLDKLAANKILKRSSCGGVPVNYFNMQVLCNETPIDNLYLVGHLTYGSFPFTSSVNVTSLQATCFVDDFIAKISYKAINSIPSESKVFFLKAGDYASK